MGFSNRRFYVIITERIGGYSRSLTLVSSSFDGGDRMSISEKLKQMLAEFMKVKDNYAEFFEYLEIFFINSDDYERRQVQKILAVYCLDFLKAGVNPNKVATMMTYNDIIKWHSELVSYGAEIDLKTLLYEAVNHPSTAVCREYFETNNVTHNNLYKLVATGADINWLVVDHTEPHDLTEIVIFKKLGASEELLIKEINYVIIGRNLKWLVDEIGFDAKMMLEQRLWDILKNRAARMGLTPGSRYEENLAFLRDKKLIGDDEVRYLVKRSCDHLNKRTFIECSGKEFAGVKITPEWLISNTLMLKIFDIFDCRNDEDLVKYADNFRLKLDKLLEYFPGEILFEYHQGYPEDFDEFLRRFKQKDIIKALGRSFYAYCREHQDKIGTMDCLRRMLTLTWHGADIEADLVYLSYAKRFEDEDEIWSDAHVRIALELLDAGIKVTTADAIAMHLDYERLATSGERFGIYRALKEHDADEEYLKKLEAD